MHPEMTAVKSDVIRQYLVKWPDPLPDGYVAQHSDAVVRELLGCREFWGVVDAKVVEGGVMVLLSESVAADHSYFKEAGSDDTLIFILESTATWATLPKVAAGDTVMIRGHKDNAVLPDGIVVVIEDWEDTVRLGEVGHVRGLNGKMGLVSQMHCHPVSAGTKDEFDEQRAEYRRTVKVLGDRIAEAVKRKGVRRNTDARRFVERLSSDESQRLVSCWHEGRVTLGRITGIGYDPADDGLEFYCRPLDGEAVSIKLSVDQVPSDDVAAILETIDV